MGDRIIAYCNNKMQICTVKRILDSGQTNNITLSVFTSDHYRISVSRTLRFKRDALVDLAGSKFTEKSEPIA